jgi:hypothetical protein
LLEAAQGDLAFVQEDEALAGGQLPHDIRNEHLPPTSGCRRALGQDYGRPEQVVALGDGLTGVDANADAHGLAVDIEVTKSALQLDGALERLLR